MPVHVLNANSKAVQLNRGTVVALIHEVEDFVMTGEDESLPIRQLGVVQDLPIVTLMMLTCQPGQTLCMNFLHGLPRN